MDGDRVGDDGKRQRRLRATSYEKKYDLDLQHMKNEKKPAKIAAVVKAMYKNKEKEFPNFTAPLPLAQGLTGGGG